MVPKAFRIDENKIFRVDGKANKTVVNLFNKFKNNKSGNLIHIPNIGAMGKPTFLNLNAKRVFNHLWLAFIKALISQHFDLESHIWIKIDTLSYAIGEILSKLNLDSNVSLNDSNKSDFNQWHLVIYFSKKIILIGTWYKIYNAKLLVIV